ncbi:MAG TPA: tRNA (adenosine(37)-N6)-threonylcarbamoyltransferase complex dimerization subunit type 1 TsaB [Mesorhizobium sp.]
MILLVIDTSARFCAAAILAGETEFGRESLDLGKGHAEHLMAVIETALHKAGKSYADLDAVAVAIGPGSFTGVRVGVATARGLALALKVPALGVSNLEAVAAQEGDVHPGRFILAAFASAKGDIQAALYDPRGNGVYSPAVIDLAHAVQLASDHDAIIVGSAAAAIQAEAPGLATGGDMVTADIGVYARLALAKPRDGERPKPLYLREPDAKPQAGFVLARTSR